MTSARKEGLAEGRLVSIIVPSYNKERFIPGTIRSVQAQTYPHWELLVVDDASTDGTVALVKAEADRDPRIKLFAFDENKGANHCRNKGIELASGKYIVFLDADDILAPDCLEQRVATIYKSGYDFCVFTMHVFHEKVGDSNHGWIPDTERPLADFFMHKLPWSIMQPIWRTDRMRELGGFDESFSRHQDVDLHTRALLRKGVAWKQVVGRPDCFYRISDERKNYDAFGLVGRWTDSAIKYYFKFLPAAKERNMAPLLLGIINKTYLQILYHRKIGGLDDRQFAELEKKLLDPRIIAGLSLWKRALLKASRAYNLMPIRIPGVNKLFDTLLVQ
ncbi:MAG: glycosyltransferase family 2 protein [Flavobacteriales bacterium]|nr:glycosyltransferase family 2 protein [Flavobacteriales bacterium]